jgi:hypothetical protein
MTSIDTITPAAPARRPRRLPIVAVFVAVAALLAAVGAAGAVRHRSGRSADAGPVFLDWPARGSLRGDTARIAEAVRLWDEGFGGPGAPGYDRRHSDIRVLYAEQLDLGQVFVLQGRDDAGVPELGLVFIPPRTGYGGAPHDVESFAVPSPLLTHHVSFTLLTDVAGTGAKLVVLAEPGTTAIAWAEVAHPETFIPMYVSEGVGIAEFTNRGVRRIRVGTPDSTVYEGPMDRHFLSVIEPAPDETG